MRIELDRPGTVTGVVFDPDGTPIEGARVHAVPAGAHLPSGVVYTDEGKWVPLSATSGPDGRYEIHDLRSGGFYSVAAGAEGFARSPAVEDVRVTADRHAVALDLRLRRQGAVVLRLLGPDGAPLVDAPLAGQPGPFAYGSGTNGSGTIRGGGLDPGAYRARVAPVGLPARWVEFEVEGGRTTEVEVRLEAGFALSGVVVDERGQPVAGARVVAAWPPGSGPREPPDCSGSAEAAAEGRFRIGGLLPAPYRVRASAPGYSGTWGGPFMAPADDVRVEVCRFARVTARLLPPAG